MKNNVPVYQYKESINGKWFPPNGHTVFNLNESKIEIIFPTGDPFSKPLVTSHKRVEDIILYIKHYTYFLRQCWTTEIGRSVVGAQRRLILIQYWENVMEALRGDLVNPNNEALPLLEGFWPKTDHGTGFKAGGGSVDVEEDVQMEDPIGNLQRELREDDAEAQTMFVGAAFDMVGEPFVPLRDIHSRSFVVVRSTEEFEEEVKGRFWLGRASSVVNTTKNTPLSGQFQMDWWRPKHRKRNPTNVERYQNCFQHSQMWEVDPDYLGEPSHWMSASSTITAWDSRSQKNIIKIPANTLESINENIASLSVEE
ncbi:unnamed protein product [Calypogeia fissa]